MNNVQIAVFVVLLYRDTSAFISSDAVNPLQVPGGHLIDKIFLSKETRGNFTELAHRCGYMADRHTVTTRDGYLLGIFRLKGRKHCNGRKRTPPVVLMHGWQDSADSWLLTGCESGLGYALADACYDVWAASHRGDYYGRDHETLDPDKDIEFWNFAFEELGEEDLPAIIDYVTEQTASHDVLYVGHSQGTTDFFVMTSSRPEYNDKIRLGILMAPIAWLDNIPTKLLYVLADNYRLVHKAFNVTGIREMLGRDQPTHKVLVEILCSTAPNLCHVPITWFGGDQLGAISRHTLQVAAGHFPSGSSVKNFIQFGQVLKYGRFARYDYGHDQNLKLYGMDPPPEFDLTKIHAPVVLMAAQSDALSVIADVNRIDATLPNVLEYYIIPDPDFGHFAFMWGKNAPQYITPKILHYFDAFSDDAYGPHHQRLFHH